ncbi:TPA: hypothetical protein ACTWZ9_000173 [Raoultella planticola]|uniref:hypothetical protein n=2 Tax=Raoultella planticola TaxID=575 RepID=UPI00093572F2|nr:hypothetical protein [Raoultella planticola]RNN90757.1 hypothetical protein BL127_00025195 [Raoultella planticola]
MYHLDNTSGVPEMPEPKDEQSISPRWFGESQQQGGISWPGADWFNIIQAELLSILDAAGIQVEKKQFNQITQAIKQIGGDGLRQSLESDAEGEGGYLVRLRGGGTVADALTRVNVLRFGADPTGQTDSSAAARKARNFAVARGINEIYWPAGDYVCADYTEDVYLPGDDGTVNPAWVGVNGDVNIAPEVQYKAKTFCRLPRGMRVTGDGKNATRIRGNWNNATSPIPTNIADVPASAGYGFFWTNADNKSAVNSHSIIGVTLAQYYVARGADGIIVGSFEDDLIIEDCAYSGIFQGAERCHSAWLDENRVYAPTIVGGHWLQRNNTQTISMLPPYPATDAWTLGWCDAWTYGTHHHTQYQGAWGSRHIAIDNFFDNMYFKSRNTPTYANGGRLSNNSNNPVAIPGWFGVAGRARVLLSRYARQINSNSVNFVKSMGEHRTPYYCATPNGNNVIHDCFLEAVGLVDNRMAAVGGNYFGIAVPDPLNPARAGIGYMAGEGGIQLANYTTSARLQHAPLVSVANRLYGSQQYVNFVPNNVDNYELERRSLWDGANTVIKYARYSQYQFSQPIAFSLGGEKFSYSVMTFTPILNVGGADIADVDAIGYLIKNGRQLTLRCRFTKSGEITLPAGAVKVKGLPYSILNNLFGISFGFVYCEQLASELTVFPRVKETPTEITLVKNSKGTPLSGADIGKVSGLALFVEMTASILE